jgi:undecaprenyl-diphosphatase
VGLFEAVVLAVVQGLTEFLPVSSDGHLILVPSLLGWERFGLGFDVMLHVATLAAALFGTRPDQASDRRLALLLLGATVPSVIVVFALESFVSGVERRPVEQQIVISAVGLLITSVVLGGSELIARAEGRRSQPIADSAAIPWGKALLVGVAQGFAALPGVSRSGLTISAGQALGITRGESARFSFLLSIPIIAAATAKKSLDIAQGQGSLPPLGVTLTGVAVTAAVGYAVIWFLIPFVRRHSLWWFSAYTAFAGILLLIRYAL